MKMKNKLSNYICMHCMYLYACIACTCSFIDTNKIYMYMYIKGRIGDNVDGDYPKLSPY